MPSTPPARFRFSVIIPLEFHRGQVEACLNLWTQKQEYDPEQFEIVAIACHKSIDQDTRAFFQTLLRKQDRLILSEHPHDIALCIDGARESQGEIFFFTEAHCLPEPDVLRKADETIRQHPEWAGFSCYSHPITHNLLSVVESEMYMADIQIGMNHPWRNILDQCFAVRAEAYRQSGGFRREFGHFGEWILAAQMHKLGLRIGYTQNIQINHYYYGNIDELTEFSLDFTQGEMRLYGEYPNDAWPEYFAPPQEWVNRYQWQTPIAKQVFSLAIKNLSAFRLRPDALIQYWLRASSGARTALWAELLRNTLSRWALSAELARGKNTPGLYKRFVQVLETATRAERIRYAARWCQCNPNNALSTSQSLTWKPGESLVASGIHACETKDGQSFCWFEPAGLLEAALQPGSYRLRMAWLPFLDGRRLKAYINGRELTLQKQTGQAESAVFEVSAPGNIQIGWVTQAIISHQDSRMLGLPLTRLEIFPIT